MLKCGGSIVRDAQCVSDQEAARSEREEAERERRAITRHQQVRLERRATPLNAHRLLC